jgi:hypothetical protein
MHKKYNVSLSQTEREATVKVHWQFTNDDTRTKLKSLYPKIEI